MTPGDLDPMKRRSIRLQTWNYSAVGAYFVTVVTHERRLLFANIIDGTVRLSAYGEIAQEEWLASASIRKELDLDIFVVMPDHVHGIVWLVGGGYS
jgi:putative transposase